jgi:putative transposase
MGCKRHVLVDTMGLVWGVMVHAANIQDRDGARSLIRRVRFSLPRLRVVWADAGYAGALVAWVATFAGWALQIVHREVLHAFELLPHRWVVERTFGWLGRYRRLSRDYEGSTNSSEAMVLLAMINLMVHRLRPERKRPRK